MAIPTFTYSQQLGKYRYTSGSKNGQFVSRATILELIEQRIDAIQEDIEVIADLLTQNKISLATFESEMMRAVKLGSAQSYILGRGGIDRLTQSDYSRINAITRQQAIYLRRFTSTIATGKLSKNQIQARAAQYANNFYSVYESARKESFRVAGYRWEKRVLNAAEHCPDCLRLAGMGWQILGTLNPIGVGVQCKSNDRCSFTYSKEIIRPSNDTLLGQKFGWLDLKLG